MSITITTAMNDAMSTTLVGVEASFLRGFAGIQIIGNVSELCRDGKERARSALEQMGLSIPAKKIVMSFTPGDLRKDGNHLDLAMGVSLGLLISGQSPHIRTEEWLFAAELGLDGTLRPITGIVPFALTAIQAGKRGLVIAQENAEDLASLENLLAKDRKRKPADDSSQTHHLYKAENTGQSTLEYQAFSSLSEVFEWVQKGTRAQLEDTPKESKAHAASCCELGSCDHSSHPLTSSHPSRSSPPGSHPSRSRESQHQTSADHHSTDHHDTQLDYSDMDLSEELADIACAIAVGGHSLLLKGTPGTGKSMFAARLPSVLPLMPKQQHLESLQIYSLSHRHIPRPLLAGQAPFRSPHHQASSTSLLGNTQKPGELSLAHGGVLFLDEIPEFRRDFLEAMRGPMETGEVHVARAKGRALWKARIILLASANPCPCGWFGSAQRSCSCPMNKILAYRQKLSGPILDRIDLHIRMEEPPAHRFEDLLGKKTSGPTNAATTTERMRQRVRDARAFALERLSASTRSAQSGLSTSGASAPLDTSAASSAQTGMAAESTLPLNRDLPAMDLSEALGQTPAQLVSWLNELGAQHLSMRARVRCLRVARTLADLDQSMQTKIEHVERALGWQQQAGDEFSQLYTGSQPPSPPKRQSHPTGDRTDLG